MNFQNAVFAAAYGTVSQLPEPERMEFAFVGRSNVGKSTLINKIVNRKSLARTSSVPGKTATINFYRAGEVYFTDLPGYGYAKASKSEQERLKKLIAGYLHADRDLRLVVQLLDMRHAPSEEDLQMINQLIDNEIPFILVLTKSDKLNKTERQARMQAFAQEIPCFADICTVPFSAKNFEGLETLREILSEIAEEPEQE